MKEGSARALMLPTDSNLLTVAEASKMLGVPVRTVYTLIHASEIPAVSIGGHWRILRHALERQRSHALHRNGSGPILLLSTDPLARAVVARVASRFHLGFLHAADAATSRKLLSENCSCAALVDAQLLDATDLSDWVGRFRASYPFTPIAILAEYLDSGMIYRLLDCGVISLIRKPAQYHDINCFLKECGFRTYGRD